MYVCMYVCMYAITCKTLPGMDQPGKVTKPARGQLNRENEVSLLQMHPWFLPVHTGRPGSSEVNHVTF